MTILVTGTAGFIGSSFARQRLAASNEKIISLDALTYAGHLSTLLPVMDNPNHLFVHGSIGDKALVAKLLAEYKPRAVVNFAAESHVDRSIHGPEAFIETNVLGTFRLLEAVREYWQELTGEEQSQFRYLHVSTDEVYGTLGKEDAPLLRETAMSQTVRMPPVKRLPTIWYVLGITLMVCRCSRPTVAIITGRTIFRKS